MIYAVGIDIVEVERIDGILKKWKEKFIKRVYSAGEITYCENKAYPSVHYSARFAAKEAFIKCIGRGIWNGTKLKDIEVFNIKNGKPELRLHNNIKDMINNSAVTYAHLSISHTDKYATAIVVLEKS